MSVPVKSEIGETRFAVMDMERCCFCRTRTPFWTEMPDRAPGDQVACCESCAKRAYSADVPSKRVWIRRERIAEGVGVMDTIKPPREDEVATYIYKARTP